ncbi:MAG: DNA modification methyltransferase [Candidatus Rifleibacterium amylolyticum]|nr:MAG: DNA modification methyltransferase [Candidatus Rifleibacterium amylolyticum]
MSTEPVNRLFRGDMLHVASLLVPGSFRLIYLDPPFLTGREMVGSKKHLSYDDRWEGELDSYLPWLKERLQAMFSLLMVDGSLVLHLDWRASHYARVMLDEIFGRQGFINEIIWHYTGGGRSKTRFSCKHDTLLWYSRSARPVFNIDAVRVPYKKTSGYAKSGIVAASGRHYKPDPRGTPVDDVWDIPIINPLAAERVGYPTQKPLALIQRLIVALSNPGELIGDFCCGSGTTLVAAQKLGRSCVGSDISQAATACAAARLRNECGFAEVSVTEVGGSR